MPVIYSCSNYKEIQTVLANSTEPNTAIYSYHTSSHRPKSLDTTRNAFCTDN